MFLSSHDAISILLIGFWGGFHAMFLPELFGRQISPGIEDFKCKSSI
jgi:hypothetical protein